MFDAILYLRFHLFANAWLAQARRLKQPKYILGLIGGVAYLWFFLFRRGNGSIGGLFSRGSMIHAVPTVIAGWLTLYLVLPWFIVADDTGIPFSAAEVSFLFPAPLRRSGLIAYRVVSSIVAAGFSGLVMALIFSHRSMFSSHVLFTVASWILLMSALQLYSILAAVIVMRLQGASIRAARRRQILFALLVLVAAGIIYELVHTPAIGATNTPGDFIVAVGASRTLGWVLWPARLLIQPFFASGIGATLEALGLVALAVGVLALAIIRLESPFEDASISGADRLAARLQRMRQTGTIRAAKAPTSERREPFALDRVPGQWSALVWKNLLASGSWWLGMRRWLQAVAFLLVLSFVATKINGAAKTPINVAQFAIGWIGLIGSVFYGPMLMRFDLRQDLPNLDILRTYPLPGWKTMLGLILAPTTIITSYLWLSLLAMYLWLNHHSIPIFHGEWSTPSVRALMAGCAAALGPLIVGVQLFIPNLMATLFPSLIRPAQAGSAGIDQFGQRILLTFGQMFTLLIFLAPPGLLAWLLIFASKWIFGAGPALTLGGLGAAIVLVGELWIGFWWLGARFERMELV